MNAPSRPGDLAASLLTDALRDGKAILLSPGRVPGKGLWIGWQAGPDVFLESTFPALVVEKLALLRRRDFRASYRALLAEGERVRLELPTEFHGGRESIGRIDALSVLEKRTVVRLPATRLGRSSVLGREEDFAAVERTSNALHRVLTLLLGIRGIGTETDSVSLNARKLAPYVELAMLRKGKRP